MSGETAGQVACIAWNAHYAEQHGIEARNEWAASDPRGRGAWEAAAQAGHKAIAAAAPAGAQDAPGAATRNQTADATAEGDDVPDRVRDLGRSLGASGWAKVPGPDGMELAVEAGWEVVRFDVTPAAPQPAPELAEPMTVAGVLCRDYPSVVAAMQAEVDRRRFVFLRVEGERDQLREAHERQRLELLQAQGEAAETAAELVRVKHLHAALLGEVKPNGGGYTFRTTGVLLARRYAAANLPLRDDLSKLAGQ